MSKSNPNYEAMEASPHEQWEEAFYDFENYVQKKNFSPQSEYSEIVSKIRGVFVLIINTLSSFPEFGGSEEARALTRDCLDELDFIRQNNIGDENYFPALLRSMKKIAIDMNTACFVTFQDDNETPAKRKKFSKFSKPIKTTREETVVPSIPTANKFQILQQSVEMEDATVSPSITEPQRSNLTMDTSETTVPERTAVNKEPRPPPITIVNKVNVFQQNKEFKTFLKGDFKVVNTREGLRYYTTTSDDFRALKNHLEEKKIQHFSFQLKSDLPLRVVLKRLPWDTDPVDVKEELINAGFPVRSVKQITKFENNQNIKLPLFILELQNTAQAREIYNLNRLLYTVVSVESYRPRSGMKQCYRCQRFNHTFPGCKLTPRCLLCAENHEHKDCPIKAQAVDNKSLLKCANCNEKGHVASYRQCKSYVEALELYNKPRNSPVNNRNNNNNRNHTTNGNKFDSRRTTHELSFSSALRGKQPPPGYPRASGGSSGEGREERPPHIFLFSR